MGSFEKLGILVIVVIIVMILAVAIYQWGGSDLSSGLSHGRSGVRGSRAPAEMRVKGPNERGPREVDYLPPESGSGGEEQRAGSGGKEPNPVSNQWPGGVPKVHVIQSGDVVWNLVVKDWQLKEGFTLAIARENPRVDMKRLRPGQEIRIPNPSAYRAGKRSARKSAPKGGSSRRNLPKGVRTIEVQEGDTFGSIAKEQLGRASRAAEIQRLNPSIKPRRLRPGQKLYLPPR
ncbi:MAG: LysM peptidoglycan-binding domain-containing protein [Planctomycetota bacterium]|jgi:LysM repeat protein